MKKKYTAPMLTSVKLHAASMLCLSLGSTDGDGVADAPARRGGFDWDPTEKSDEAGFDDTLF